MLRFSPGGTVITIAVAVSIFVAALVAVVMLWLYMKRRRRRVLGLANLGGGLSALLACGCSPFYTGSLVHSSDRFFSSDGASAEQLLLFNPLNPTILSAKAAKLRTV